MTNPLNNFEWDKVPLELLEMEYNEYFNDLYGGLDPEDPQSEVGDTLSGVPFCGCEGCEQREIFSFLLPRFIALYEQGHIRKKVVPNGL